MNATFAVTDPEWLDDLKTQGTTEVNFWQPQPTPVRQLPGTPWIFKVRGANRVAGFGFFSYWTIMPLSIAWSTFGRANGVATLDAMRLKVRALRRGSGDDRVGCVVLSDVSIIDAADRPAAPADWKPNIMRIVRYDIASGEGARVWKQLRSLDAKFLQPAFSPLLQVAGGYNAPSLVAARRGQGAFRLMVMDAYERRCAITGEHTLPVLEAAHIRPYATEAVHDVRNGILMRSDIHKLYDAGLVTVQPDLTFRVSPDIDRDYSNGKIYYALDGKTVSEPQNPEARPDPALLNFHATKVFRP